MNRIRFHIAASIALVVTLLILAAPGRARGQSISGVTPLSAGPLNVTVAASSCTTTGTTCVILNTGGYTALSIQVTGTWSGTLQFEMTVDGTTWVAVNMTPPSSTTAVTSTTANGVWTGTSFGRSARVRASTLSSGTAVVTIKSTLTAKSGGGGSGGPPTGAAGGDLAGTYPNPTIASSVALSGSPTTTTQSAGDSTTKLATTSFVGTAVANAIAAVNPAIAVGYATTTNLPNSPIYNNGVAGIGATLTTATTNTALVVDGHTMVLSDRLLVKNETAGNAPNNGIYSVTQVQGIGLAWILTRVLDFDQPSDMNNTGAIPVVNGTANAQTQWVMSSAVATVGTDAVTFTQFSINPSSIACPALTYTAKTTTYTAVACDFVVATSGTFTVTLPAASSNTNKDIVVINGGSGTTTIGRTGSDAVGNQAETSYTLNPGDGFTWHSNGSAVWHIR